MGAPIAPCGFAAFHGDRRTGHATGRPSGSLFGRVLRGSPHEACPACPCSISATGRVFLRPRGMVICLGFVLDLAPDRVPGGLLMAHRSRRRSLVVVLPLSLEPLRGCRPGAPSSRHGLSSRSFVLTCSLSLAPRPGARPRCHRRDSNHAGGIDATVLPRSIDTSRSIVARPTDQARRARRSFRRRVDVGFPGTRGATHPGGVAGRAPHGPPLEDPEPRGPDVLPGKPSGEVTLARGSWGERVSLGVARRRERGHEVRSVVQLAATSSNRGARSGGVPVAAGSSVRVGTVIERISLKHSSIARSDHCRELPFLAWGR